METVRQQVVIVNKRGLHARASAKFVEAVSRVPDGNAVRVGKDGNGLPYSGDSVVVDPKGEVISRVEPSQEGLETIRLDWKALAEFRAKFPVLVDADMFVIRD